MSYSRAPRRHNSSQRGGSSSRTRGGSSGPRRGNSRSFHSGRSQRGQGRSGRGGARISQDKFINKDPVQQTAETYTPKHTFADFKLHSHVYDNLTKNGYTTPTHIQDEAIPHILEGHDVVGLANTGSGKTAAFVLPLIHKLKTQKQRKSVLVITPTRELAQQINAEFRKFSEGMQVYSTVCVGGLNIRPQIRDLRRGPHMIIGTPGRLKDLLQQGELRLEHTTTLVLDEADQMLDMGFLPDVTAIVNALPKEGRQSLCFSATLSREVNKLLDSMLKEPVKISVRTSETGEHIAQDIIKARTPDEKLKELERMLVQDHFERVLIFTEMKHVAQKLADKLNEKGFAAIAIHGNKSQIQRQKALSAFKEGRADILVATGVASRGLDIPDVSHVINYDQPQTHDEYVHRIGRTGRAGKAGQAYTFV